MKSASVKRSPVAKNVTVKLIFNHDYIANLHEIWKQSYVGVLASKDVESDVINSIRQNIKLFTSLITAYCSDLPSPSILRSEKVRIDKACAKKRSLLDNIIVAIASLLDLLI